jgi:chitin synthase
MSSTNSLPVQLLQNGIILTLKMFPITPSSPLLVATVFHLVLSVTTPLLWPTCEQQCGLLASNLNTCRLFFSLLVAILLLGNLQFTNGDSHDVSAHVSNPHILNQVARLLGVSAASLGACQGQSPFIANHPFRPTWIPGSGRYIVHVPLGHPTLVSAYGQNGFDEFCINFADEMLQSYVLRHTFENSIGYNECMVQDAVTLPSISTMDNRACIKLLQDAQLSEPLQRKPGSLLGVINKACSSYKSGEDGEQR